MIIMVYPLSSSIITTTGRSSCYKEATMIITVYPLSSSIITTTGTSLPIEMSSPNRPLCLNLNLNLNS